MGYVRQLAAYLPSLLAFSFACCWDAVSGGALDAAHEVPVESRPFGSSTLDDQNEFFEERIRPVLIEHCYECHAPQADGLAGGLDVSTQQGLLKGGDSGPSLVPGDADQSLLLEAMRYESFEMPPESPLPSHVIEDFERWINLGAADPRTETSGSVSPLDINKPWSFEALMDAPIRTEPSRWAQNPIDHYIFGDTVTSESPPVPRAPKEVLIRRAYFDLIGLPPTPEQIESFVTNDQPEAWTHLVDQLLSSPQFGERWGRHWLDAVRYADSSGGGRAILYPLAYRYRDYVIASFNSDLPYDQFITEQIAGDLLQSDSVELEAARLSALGFLALGPTNFELQDKELLRMEVVDEQIDTIGRAMLGMSIGCARCHDHKFDPIPTKDYYALAGILRSTKTLLPGNVSGYVRRQLPQNAEDAETWAAYQAMLATQNRELERLKQQQVALDARMSERFGGTLPAGSVCLDDDQADLIGNWTQSTSVRGYFGDGYSHSSAADASAIYRLRAPQAGEYQLLVSYTANPNRSSKTRLAYRWAEQSREATLNQKTAPQIGQQFDEIATLNLSEADELEVILYVAGADGVVIADAVAIIPVNTSAETEEQRQAKAKLEEQLETVDRQVEEIESEINRLKQQAPPAPVQVMGVQEEASVEDYAICIRGNVHRLGESVPRGALSEIEQLPELSIAADQSGRLELARWIANGNNPLTSRVYVNRIWHHLFGEGIVASLDNFGNSGDRPSNRLLLDHLAQQFGTSSYSTKSMIRYVMHSHAYQMDLGHHDDQQLHTLATGRLSRRVDAEFLRDSILALSGGTQSRMGLPAFPGGTRNEFSMLPDDPRRTVYLPVFRNNLNELVAVFDFADPNLVSGGRTATTLPTQALLLMNQTWINEQAHLAAKQLLQAQRDPAEQLERLFQMALGRKPYDQEQRVLLEYIQLANVDSAADELSVWTTVVHSVYASLDFRFIR